MAQTLSNIENLMKQIEPMFKELNENLLKRQLIWAYERSAAIKKFKDENKDSRRAMGEEAYYKKLFAISGGKSWFNLLNNRTDEQIEQIINDNVKGIIEHRNALICRKLNNREVTSIDGTATYHSDGFEGRYSADTNMGKKIVHIKVIVAGGYNIQCLHCRTLVKIW